MAENQHPLQAEHVKLKLFQTNCDQQRPATAKQQGDNDVLLHVSRAVLDTCEFFHVSLSERWAGSEPIQLHLPAGCSAEAAQQLLLRLYLPLTGRFDWDWGCPDLRRVLELVQLADMLMLRSRRVEEELQQLLWKSVRKVEDTVELQRYCSKIEGPAWLARLAGCAEEGTKEVVAMLSDSQIKELMHSVCITGDTVAAAALEKVFSRRSKLSIRHAQEVAELVAQLLESRDHLQLEETVRGSIYKLREGSRTFLDIVTSLIRSCPSQLPTIARAFYIPLIGEHLPLCRLAECATAQYKDTTAKLFAEADGEHLPFLLSNIIEAGHFDCLEDPVAFSAAFNRVDAAAQMTACRVLTKMIKVLGEQGSWRLLRSMVNSVSPRVSASAQLELCGAISELIADLQYQLINGELLCSMAPEAQVKLCGILVQLEPRRVHSTATASVLSSLCLDARRLLCAVLVPQVHTLAPDVQTVVLEELDGASRHAAKDCDTVESELVAASTNVCMQGNMPAARMVLVALPLIIALSLSKSLRRSQVA